MGRNRAGSGWITNKMAELIRVLYEETAAWPKDINSACHGLKDAKDAMLTENCSLP